LHPKWRGGHPKAIDEQTREKFCLIARTPPADWKITAFSTWSLTKLAEHLIAKKIVPTISRETLRRILRDGKVTWQATTTWQASTDPDFLAKMHTVRALYDHPPTDDG
jgi:transposase